MYRLFLEENENGSDKIVTHTQTHYANGVRITISINGVHYISRTNAFDGQPANVKFNKDMDIANEDPRERRRIVELSTPLFSSTSTFHLSNRR